MVPFVLKVMFGKGRPNNHHCEFLLHSQAVHKIQTCAGIHNALISPTKAITLGNLSHSTQISSPELPFVLQLGGLEKQQKLFQTVGYISAGSYLLHISVQWKYSCCPSACIIQLWEGRRP